VKGGDVYDEQKRGDGGSLSDPDRDGGAGARGSLEPQATSAVPEERAGPLDQVGAVPFPAEEREERGRFHIIKTSLYIKEESGDFVAEAMERLNSNYCDLFLFFSFFFFFFFF